MEANRLRKNGDLKVRNWFKRFPVWLTYSAIVMTGMILWYGYEDIGTKIVNCSWFDTDFVIVQKHGCYFVPRDMTSLGVIGVPNSENESLEDYLLDQNIPVTILRK